MTARNETKRQRAAVRKAIATRKSIASRRRLTARKMTAQLLGDLCERLNDQLVIAAAIQKAVAPTGESSWPLLKVIELAADAHFQQLSLAAEFAGMIRDRAGAVQS